jgi:drug/metabolite transporter (DMT)-like permease
MTIMASELAVTIYALASALAWGAGDFGGGLASRHTPVFMVLGLSQLIGITCLLGVIALFSEPFPQVSDLFFGACGGIANVIGLAAFYRGLANSPMGVVAPIAAVVSAVVPVLISFFVEGLPATTQIMGLALAIASLWTISRAGETIAMQLHQWVLPVLGGLGFACFFICIDQVSEGVVFWPLVAARCAPLLLLASIILSQRRWRTPPRRRLPLIIMVGVFDTAGNTFFALAANAGRLDTAAVLASLYPATTVLLACFVLQERLNRKQWMGVMTALLAVMLIAL